MEIATLLFTSLYFLALFYYKMPNSRLSQFLSTNNITFNTAAQQPYMNHAVHVDIFV